MEEEYFDNLDFKGKTDPLEHFKVIEKIEPLCKSLDSLEKIVLDELKEDNDGIRGDTEDGIFND